MANAMLPCYLDDVELDFTQSPPMFLDDFFDFDLVSTPSPCRRLRKDEEDSPPLVEAVGVSPHRRDRRCVLPRDLTSVMEEDDSSVVEEVGVSEMYPSPPAAPVPRSRPGPPPPPPRSFPDYRSHLPAPAPSPAPAAYGYGYGYGYTYVSGYYRLARDSVEMCRPGFFEPVPRADGMVRLREMHGRFLYVARIVLPAGDRIRTGLDEMMSKVVVPVYASPYADNYVNGTDFLQGVSRIIPSILGDVNWRIHELKVTDTCVMSPYPVSPAGRAVRGVSAETRLYRRLCSRMCARRGCLPRHPDCSGGLPVDGVSDFAVAGLVTNRYLLEDPRDHARSDQVALSVSGYDGGHMMMSVPALPTSDRPYPKNRDRGRASLSSSSSPASAPFPSVCGRWGDRSWCGRYDRVWYSDLHPSNPVNHEGQF